jgi:hypothetical protein
MIAELLQEAGDWFLGLGEQYGVNPIIFGSIYVGAIPFFSLSLGWLIRNLKKGKPFMLQAILTLFFFVSAYLYLIIAGRNVPVWVYGVVLLMIGFGAYSTWQKIRDGISKKESGDEYVEV